MVEVVHGDEYDNGMSHLSNVVSLIFILYACCVVSGPGMALVVEFVPFSLVVLSIVDWQYDCSSGDGQQTRGRTIH